MPTENLMSSKVKTAKGVHSGELYDESSSTTAHCWEAKNLAFLKVYGARRNTTYAGRLYSSLSR